MERVRVEQVALAWDAHLRFFRSHTGRALHDAVDLVSSLDPLTHFVLVGLRCQALSIFVLLMLLLVRL